MADQATNQGPEHIPVDTLERDIHVDIQRTQEDVRTSAEWLVLFRRARGDIYDGYYDLVGLEAWIIQMKRILETTHTLMQYWVSFATIQLGRLASLWWYDLGADSHTTIWSSFTGALREKFEVPLAPPSPVMHLVVDPEEEDPEEEDPSEDLMDDEEHAEAEAEQVPKPDQCNLFLEAHDRSSLVFNRVSLGRLQYLEDAHGATKPLRHELCL